MGELQGYMINIDKHFQKLFTKEFSEQVYIVSFGLDLKSPSFHLAAVVMTLFHMVSACFCFCFRENGRFL